MIHPNELACFFFLLVFTAAVSDGFFLMKL